MSARVPITCSCDSHAHPDGGALKFALHPKHNCAPDSKTGVCTKRVDGRPCLRRWRRAGLGWKPVPKPTTKKGKRK